MREIQLKEASLAALLSIIEGQPGGYDHLFRGQSDAAWGLLPSLYRIKDLRFMGITPEEAYTSFEADWICRFFDDGLPYLPSIPRSRSNDRILAQHFGVPTRLLDWSNDPLVATYFAVEDRGASTDAAIFMVVPDAYYLPEQVNRLVHQVIGIYPPSIDARITAQKSIFTYHPYGDPSLPFVPLNERADIGSQITTTSGLVRRFAKIIIPSGIRHKLRGALASLGYNRRMLFPGLDGVGADIGARARTGQLPS